MFISHKNNVLQYADSLEWQCRRKTKGLDKAEYWAWLESVTTDGVADFSGETGYTIVECNDEQVGERLQTLDDYYDRRYVGQRTWDVKYYASKRNAEEIKDMDGNSHDPKQYVSSHFVGDEAGLLQKKWTQVREKRTRLLKETDYFALSDMTLTSDMKTYRQELRNVPTQGDPDNVSWPTKPS